MGGVVAAGRPAIGSPRFGKRPLPARNKAIAVSVTKTDSRIPCVTRAPDPSLPARTVHVATSFRLNFLASFRYNGNLLAAPQGAEISTAHEVRLRQPDGNHFASRTLCLFPAHPSLAILIQSDQSGRDVIGFYGQRYSSGPFRPEAPYIFNSTTGKVYDVAKLISTTRMVGGFELFIYII